MEFYLNAYAARSCPVVTQHQFNPMVELVGGDESLRDAFHGGILFQDHVLDTVVERFRGRLVDLRPLFAEPSATQVDACLAALGEGVDVVVGGLLPVDLVGHRSGRADLWVRGPDSADGGPGYYPVECKKRRVLERRPLPHDVHPHFSTLATVLPARAKHVGGIIFRYSSRELDLIQMAHYWRQLEALGFAADGAPRAGVIGTDHIGELSHDPVISWVELAEPSIRTFSRTAPDGWALRSALERYDHEHGFRCRVARRALEQTGSPDDPPLLVHPIVVRECERCVWWSRCESELDDDDLSLRISKAPLDVREIQVLRSLGVRSITELAGADLDELLPRYLPEVTHRPGAEERIRLAARRADLLLRGVQLERIDPATPVEMPAAGLEIDFDIETSADDRIYLWGFLVDDHVSEPRYVEFSSFAHLDDAAEAELARAAMGWLLELVEGRDARVYHYSDYEVVRLQRLVDRTGDPTLAQALAFARGRFVDLFTLVRTHFFGTAGLGLKVVAHAGAGFSWRDDDPGGLNSQRWFAEALAGDDHARTRVLEYNEDDVRATHHVRRWLRGVDGAPR